MTARFIPTTSWATVAGIKKTPTERIAIPLNTSMATPAMNAAAAARVMMGTALSSTGISRTTQVQASAESWATHTAQA